MDLDDAAGGCDVRDRGFPFMMDGWMEGSLGFAAAKRTSQASTSVVE